jgi:hypothetical protein
MGRTVIVALLACCLVLSGCLPEKAETKKTTDSEQETNSVVLEELEPVAIIGCTNPDASNYDENATEDDGSCDIPGCTDPTAENYDETATSDDGTCIQPEPDCTDSDGDGVCAEDDACDDNPEASTQDECETEDD